jgi:hypothetical protein
MVPRFRGDNVWTPAFAGVTLQETFSEIIKFESIKIVKGERKDSSILFIQNMLVQDQAKELSLKDFLPALIQDLAPDPSFFPFCFVHLGPGSQSFPDNHRLQKSNLGGKKDHEGIVHRHHSRIIGQAEGESSMDEALFIHLHPGIHGQRDLREFSAFDPFYLSHQILGYGQVSVLDVVVTVVHTFPPSFQIPGSNPAKRGTKAQINFRRKRAKRS